jgi:hypothetical protein
MDNKNNNEHRTTNNTELHNYGYEPPITDASKPNKQIYQKQSVPAYTANISGITVGKL